MLKRRAVPVLAPHRRNYTGLATSGLVCLHDLGDPTIVQSVPDIATAANTYPLQLGSAAGVDANDPSLVAGGLSFVTDDYLVSGNLSGITMAGDWTLLVVGKFNGVIGGGVIAGLMADNNNYQVIYTSASGAVKSSTKEIAGSVDSAAITVPTDAYVVLSLKNQSGQLIVARLDTGESQTITSQTPIGTPHLRLGSLVSASYIDAATIVSDGLWSRALTDSEVVRAHRYFKARATVTVL